MAARISRGKQALAANDLEQAYTIFSQLLRDYPSDPRVNLNYGLVCFSLKEYSRASLAFERALAVNPKDGSAWTMLGRCELAMQQYALAREHLQKALELNPPPGVEERIRGYLRQAKHERKAWGFTGRLDGGVFRDDNVNVGPDADIISIDPIYYGTAVFTELEVSDESQPLTVEGAFGSVSLGASFDPGQPGRWLMATDASCYRNWITDEPKHESLYIQGSAGLRRMGPRTGLHLPVRAAYVETGGDPLVTMVGVVPSLLVATGPMKELHFVTAAVIESRDYDELDDRDTVYIAGGETLRYFFGDGRHTFSLGIIASHDRTDAEEYEYKGLAWNFGTSFGLPLASKLYFRLRHTVAVYEDRELLAPDTREDEQDYIMVGLTKMITRHWGIDANYQATDNDSTFDLYVYDRNVTTVSTFVMF